MRRGVGRERCEKMIEVTNLTKKYGNHVAVDHLSFRVEKGQIYGFLGPNGAGKSTTMNMITGYLAPTEGSISIDGKDMLKEPEEAKRKIGYLPELPPLYMEMTVQEYLLFAAELKKISKAERKVQVEKVMEMTQIADMRGRLIRNLSKGYRQRVGLAQAILGDPDVIILDEPSVGLDPKQMIEIRDLIRKLGEAHTVILSSHILSEVSAVCDHIMIISHGKLVASDSPDALQKLMNGSMEILLTVKGKAGELKEALEALPGIKSIEEQEVSEQGSCKVRITAEGEEDIRESVFYALAQARLPIMEMHPEKKSLEDIFLELTESEALAVDAGGTADANTAETDGAKTKFVTDVEVQERGADAEAENADMAEDDTSREADHVIAEMSEEEGK